MKNKLILGTVQMGLDYGINNIQGKVSLEDSLKIMSHAFKKGIRFLDTAEAYGYAHEVIGIFHKNNPETQFNIITKVPKIIDENTVDRIYDYLKILDVESLHTLMFHAFVTYKNNPKALENMIQLKKQGTLKNIGISVYTNEELEEVIDDEAIDVIQIPFNLLDNWSLRGHLIEKAKAKGKTIHSRSAFLQGLFFKDLKSDHKVVKALKNELALLNAIANEEKVSLSSLALNYCLDNNLIDNVLIGVDTIQQLDNNLAVAGQKISNNALRKINNVVIQDLKLLNPSLWN